MEFLRDVLNLVPLEWDRSQTYDDKLFVLIEVPEDSDEYTSVKNEYIHSKNITKIERIQHPFAYGRFLIRKEQLEKQGNSSTMLRNVVGIRTDDAGLSKFINYNCDDRRTVSGSRQYYVVKKVFHQTQSRDTDWYPEYLITVA